MATHTSQQADDFWRDLYYIQVRSGGKMPAKSWGGYNQDFDEAEDVLEWEDLKSNVEYAYIGHKEHDLGVVDIDVYKDYAAPGEEISYWDGNLVVKSPSGGFHIPFLVRDGSPDLRIRPKLNDWVDLKGEINKGHVLLPYNNDYQVVQEGKVRVIDPENDAEHEHVAQVRNEGMLETYSRGQIYEGDNPYQGIHTLLPETQYPVGERTEHPFHGSSTGSNFQVDENEESWRCWRHETTGNLLHLIGMQNDILECGEWEDMSYNEWADVKSEILEIARQENIRVHEPQDLAFVPGVER